MRTFLSDLRYAARTLRKNPGFSLVAMLTLALGIGATTTIFTIVNGILLRPLPYPQPDRLLWVGQQYQSGRSGAGIPKFMFWREQSQSFDGIAAFQEFNGGGNLAGGDEAEFVDGLQVSQDFFRVFGIQPALGRGFTSAEDSPDGERVIILTDGLWRRRFGGDRGLIGRTIRFNDQNVTVIGVMPPEFRFTSPIDVLTPLRPTLQSDPNPNATVVGRLKPGIPPTAALAELKSIAEKYRAANPDLMMDGESVTVQPYGELFTEDIRSVLLILFGAVGFLLLIACANVANLQLARATGRRREIAVRMSIGATGGRIVRQLLTEGLMLSVGGALLGLAFAYAASRALTAVVPRGYLSAAQDLEFDWRVPVFALAAAVATCVIFGLAPAVMTSRLNVSRALKEHNGKASGSRGRLRGTLVVVEVALSLMLLIGAGLLVLTFASLRGVSPGFDPRHVLTARIALKGDRYDTTAEVANFYRDALDRLRALPGVEAAAITNILPLEAQLNLPIFFPDNPETAQSVQFRTITPDYFQVMKTDLKQGRAFTASDTAAGMPVAIVNEAFVRKYCAGRSPFDQGFTVGRTLGEPARQIVGVVADQKQFGLGSNAPAMVFLPLPQLADKLLQVTRRYADAYITLRVAGSPAQLNAAMKREIAAIDPTLALSDIRPMDQIVAGSIAQEQFNMLLFGSFAVAGLLLTIIGIYGVVAYSVGQRTHEIGIRMAIGAQRSDVLKLIVGHGMTLVAVGVGIGLVGAFLLSKVLKSMLFGVTERDPATFLLVPVLLGLAALLACWIPARRAARVDPMRALRSE